MSASLRAFDAILCHRVLMYVEDPGSTLRALRSAAREGAMLSLLERAAGMVDPYRRVARLVHLARAV